MRTRLLHALVIAFGLSQIQATCVYSPPPLLHQGQGGETLGTGNVSVAGEGGFGAAGSWWKAKNAGDPDVNTGFVGSGRVRAGVGDDINLGVFGGVGPESTFVFGPELKWRFAHIAPIETEDAPGFHAALISGVGVGAADYRYGPQPRRHVFGAPYTGVVASGGIPFVQMFTGFRLAGSETFGNGVTDLTLYPVLAFGVRVNPSRTIGLYAEGDLAGGITTRDANDSAILGFASAGVSVTFEGLWGKSRK